MNLNWGFPKFIYFLFIYFFVGEGRGLGDGGDSNMFGPIFTFSYIQKIE